MRLHSDLRHFTEVEANQFRWRFIERDFQKLDKCLR